VFCNTTSHSALQLISKVVGRGASEDGAGVTSTAQPEKCRILYSTSSSSMIVKCSWKKFTIGWSAWGGGAALVNLHVNQQILVDQQICYIVNIMPNCMCLMPKLLYSKYHEPKQY